jgi:hypothetical protein
MTYTTTARVGDSHPFQVSWVDPYGRPLNVENVIANIFYYVGGVKTLIGNADVPMVATDQNHRFITRVEITEGLEGEIVFCEFSATFSDDQTTITSNQVVVVNGAIDTQRFYTSF